MPATDFAKLIQPVALRLYGEPNKRLSKPGELRWGANGARIVYPASGAFKDTEGSAQGGTLDLICHVQGVDRAGALAWMESEGLLEPRASFVAPRPADRHAVKLSPGQRIVATFEFRQAGKLHYRKHRIEPGDGGRSKVFRYDHPEGTGWKAGRGLAELIPYRADDLAREGVIVMAEGERKADKLASWGFVATSHKDWHASFAGYVDGRSVIILPDNDKGGRDQAAIAKVLVEKAGGRVGIVDLPGLPDAGDVLDWQGTADELRALIEGPLDGAEPDLLPMIDPADWEGIEVPPREWQLEGWEPRRSCVLVTGLGASGKSLLYQQRMTCSAAGVPFLGIETAPGVSVYITCEDDLEELHRRQHAINEALGIKWSDLRGRLKLISLKGLQNNELCTFDSAGRMHTTPRWQSVLATVRNVGATNVVLDNVAHLFAGSEIVRNQVAAFVGLLDRLAVEINGGVILLGHPNKDGAEYSGSTAWENQVRSRIYLSLGQPDAAGIADPDARQLTNSKPNYSRRGEAISFLWHKWAFVRRSDLPPNAMQEQALNLQASAENARFLECLAKAIEERRSTSASRSAPNYAPRLFARMTTAAGMNAAAFERAMERLLHLGTVKADQNLWKRENRTWVTGLGRAQDPAQNPAQTMCTDPHTTPSQVIDNAAQGLHVHDTLISKDIKGAAHGAAAPFRSEKKPDLSRVVFPAETSVRRSSGPILAPDESPDDPVPGWLDT